MALIRDIRVFSHCNDLGGRVWNPAIRWTKKHAVFIEIVTDQGDIGLGECWCFDTSPLSLTCFIETEVAPAFLDRDSVDLEAISDKLVERATLTARHGMLASALSGFDIAIWDIRAKAVGSPLWAFLSPDGPGVAPLYRSGGLYGLDKGVPELVAEMQGMAEAGFGLSKMKVGALTPAEDLARVRAVLDALPAQSRLIIDGVYSYSPQAALAFHEAIGSDRIEAFQSPVAAQDIAGMIWLGRQGVPIMATEAEYRPEIHRILIGEGAVAFLQTAPVACGGISRVRELARMTEGTDIRLSLEVSSTAVALMAACQIAAADTRVAHVEMHSVHEVLFDRLALERRPGGDLFALPAVPGIGIDLPHDQVDLAVHLTDSSQMQEPRNVATSPNPIRRI